MQTLFDFFFSGDGLVFFSHLILYYFLEKNMKNIIDPLSIVAKTSEVNEGISLSSVD